MENEKKNSYRFIDSKRTRVAEEYRGWTRMIYRAVPSRDGYGYMLYPISRVPGYELKVNWRAKYVDARLIDPPERRAAPPAEKKKPPPRHHTEIIYEQIKIRI